MVGNNNNQTLLESMKTQQKSEKKFREFFESMMEACCIIEMIFDENGKIVDFHYLETNLAFVKHATKPMLCKGIKDILPSF